MFLSDLLMANGGFISPIKTTLRCHLGRIFWVRGHRILILLMILWMVPSCMVVGRFNILRTLTIDNRCSLIVFTCLFVYSQQRTERDNLPVWRTRSPWTAFPYNLLTWQRPSTGNCTRDWMSLWGDQLPFPLLLHGSGAVGGDPG